MPPTAPDVPVAVPLRQIHRGAAGGETSSSSSGTRTNKPDDVFTSSGDITDVESPSPLEAQPRNEFQQLPPVDGGKDAWLFLAACFILECLVWGMFPFPHYHSHTHRTPFKQHIN